MDFKYRGLTCGELLGFFYTKFSSFSLLFTGNGNEIISLKIENFYIMIKNKHTVELPSTFDIFISPGDL